MDQQQPQSQITLPVAIVAAALIIALAIFFSSTRGQNTNGPAVKPTGTASLPIEITPVSPTEHILGNPSAKFVLVEFSDLECPFCKTFHPTVQKVIDQYGKTGEVAWVYRHFPLDQIHPKTRKEAEATECAAELGGNQKFWDYLGKVFEATPSNNGLDLAVLPELASSVGLKKADFQACLDSGKYAAKIEAQYQDGLKAGVQGTPHTIIIAQKPISEKTAKALVALYEPFRDPQTGEVPIYFSDDKTKISVNGAIPSTIFNQTISILLGK